jgi:hypothetical protein
MMPSRALCSLRIPCDNRVMYRPIVLDAEILHAGRLKLRIDDVHSDCGEQSLEFAIAADNQKSPIELTSSPAEYPGLGNNSKPARQSAALPGREADRAAEARASELGRPENPREVKTHVVGHFFAGYQHGACRPRSAWHGQARSAQSPL